MNTKNSSGTAGAKPQKASITAVLKPYRALVAFLIVLALLSNGLNLALPKLVADGIDAYGRGTLVLPHLVMVFSICAAVIFLLAYLQSIIQTYASEKVALRLRTDLAARISRQNYVYIQQVNPSRLLTNLTADVDSVKMFVSQAVVAVASSIFVIVGASAMLIHTDWKLGLLVLIIIPVIGFTFFTVLKKVRALFIKGREVIDQLNKTINESVLGAALIRVINSQQPQYERFINSSKEARNLGLSTVKTFAGLIPVITLMSNLALLTVLIVGGHQVIIGHMTLGNLAAFNSYISLLIFPIVVIGFMSNIISTADAAYQRICQVLYAPEVPDTGTVAKKLDGDVAISDAVLNMGGKPVLKEVSLEFKAGTRTAIIGPTAAGKTQLLNVLVGLLKPDSGDVTYDHIPLVDYNKDSLLQQVGLVFQDSIIFNMSLRENIAFNEKVSDELMEKAIQTAELKDFIDTLPDGLSTIVSERGASLSGGQKQRIMLARALALDPQVLLLDDFTARVDTSTEQRILDNVQRNYPHLTLISVTQKIASAMHFDQIVLLMEGEVIATGTHTTLMQTCPEYVQIFNSQRSTSNYELQPE
jgi:ATP-binding cassette, subfamily B, bacterial